MKTIKRVTSLVLVLILMLGTFSVSAYAKIGGNSDEKKVYVATVYFCHKPRNNDLSGHTWLYFKNLTTHSIKVGLYTVPKGQGVSIGTFGFSIVDGKGLYYNAEAFRYHAAKTKEFTCVKKNVTQDQLNKMSDKIKKSGSWSYLLNCSYSACNIWNCTSEKPIPYLFFPPLARLSISLYSDHEQGFFMYKPTLKQVYKQIGYGDEAYMVNANPAAPPAN